MTFSEEIKSKRQELGMTQKQFAQMLHVSLSTVQNLETYDGGYRETYPTFNTVNKLRRKGIIEYTYVETKQTIDRDRKFRNRNARLKKNNPENK